MNKREIYKAIVLVLDDLEGARNLTVSAASSYEALKRLADQVDEEASAEECRNASDGSNLTIDPETLRHRSAGLVGEAPVLLRRAAVSLEQSLARAERAEAQLEELRQRPTADLAEAQAVVADLRAQLAETRSEADSLRNNPIRQLRNQFRDARIVVEFPSTPLD